MVKNNKKKLIILIERTFIRQYKYHLLFFPCDEKKIGLKQTLDISQAPYYRCKKLIKKSGVRIKPLYGMLLTNE